MAYMIAYMLSLVKLTFFLITGYSTRGAPLDQSPKREGKPERIGVAFFFV